MNWGNKMLITFGVFATGMGYLVYRSMQTNFELVERDYYKTELKYQEVIDAAAQANSLSGAVSLEQTKHGVIMQLPAQDIVDSIRGDVWFYCAYNSVKDRRFRISTDNSGRQVFNGRSIDPGGYIVKVRWQNGGREYYGEQKLIIQ